MKHEPSIERGVEPESGGYRDWRQPVCSCGWKGRKHRNYENYAFTNCQDEADRHASSVREKELLK